MTDPKTEGLPEQGRGVVRVEGQAMQQNKRGEWVPAIPLPFFGLIRVSCNCGKSFFRRSSYEAHYAYEHIIKGRP